MSRKKKLSGAFAVAAGAVAVTGGAVMAHTPSAHAETPTVAVQKTDEAKQGEEKQNTASSEASSEADTTEENKSAVNETVKTESTLAASSAETADAASDKSKSEAQEKSDTESGSGKTAETSVKSNTSEKTEKVSDNTEEKTDGNTSTKTRTEVYQHEKTTVTKSEGVPDEAEQEANKDENGNKPVKKHVTETGKETWTETKITKETTTKTETGDSKMTNADEYSGKNVYTIDKDGNAQKASDDTAAKVKDYYNKQNVTSDFAVYAKSLDGTIGHEDGNIAVDKLNTGTTVMNKDGQYAMNRDSDTSQRDIDKAYANSGYSYIGETKDGQNISSSSNFQTNGKNDSLIIYGKDEGNSYEDTDGSANHFRSIHLKNGDTVPDADKSRTSNLGEVMKIDGNLKAIGKAGASVTASVKDSLTDEQKLEAAVAILKSGKLKGNDILTLNLSSHVLKNDGKAGEYNKVNNLLTALVNENRNKVNILINVEIDKDTLSDGNTLKDLWGMMNGIQNYDYRAAYLTWNFGDFDGTISIGNTVSGSFIAPDATLNVNGIESGRMVANSASHGGEIHMAVKGNYQKSYKTETNTETSTSESEHKKETTQAVKYEYGSNKPGDSTGSSEKASEASSEKTSAASSEKASEATSEKASEASSEKASEASSEKTSAASSEKVSEATSEKASEATSEKASETASESVTNSQTAYHTKKSEKKKMESKAEENGGASVKHNQSGNADTVAESGSSATGDYRNSNPAGTEATSASNGLFNGNGATNEQLDGRQTGGGTGGLYNGSAQKGTAVKYTTDAGTSTSQAGSGVVETGDKTSFIGSIAALLTSGGIIAYLLKKRKRSKER